MERGSASTEKKKMRIGEGSAAAGGVVGAAGGDPVTVAVGRGGRSGAVAGGGRSAAVSRGGRSGGARHAAWSGATGGQRRSGTDLAAASAWAEVFDPNFKKRKNRKTRTERGLDSWKLGLRPPAFLEFDKDDGSEEEPDEDVDDDQESRDQKSRFVLRQLIAGRWEYQTGFGEFICPFCSHAKATDYDGMVAHAIGIGSGSEKRPAYVKAKHAPYGLFLQKMNVE